MEGVNNETQILVVVSTGALMQGGQEFAWNVGWRVAEHIPTFAFELVGQSSFSIHFSFLMWVHFFLQGIGLRRAFYDLSCCCFWHLNKCTGRLRSTKAKVEYFLCWYENERCKAGWICNSNLWFIVCGSLWNTGRFRKLGKCGHSSMINELQQPGCTHMGWFDSARVSGDDCLWHTSPAGPAHILCLWG